MPAAPSVTLSSALSADAAWPEVVRPWFERATTNAQGGGTASIVVAPTRGFAVALKNRALEEGMSLLGVRYLLPSELREELFGDVASRDALRLMIAAIAEEVEINSANPTERQVAGAIARAPDSFLHAYDQLDQAGWDPLEHLPQMLRGIGKAFAERIAQSGFKRIAQADRELRAAVPSTSPSLAQLLVIGFDGAHWPLFPLLTAAVYHAEQTDVVFTEPRDEARTVDSLWIQTWEQEFTATLPVAGDDRPRPMTEVLRLPELKAEIERRFEQPARCIDFLVGETAADLAKIIATCVLQNLTSCETPRIAIVFPRASALSRLVSLRLADAGVLHNDGLGHPLADAAYDPAWRAWLHLQDDRRVAPFEKFIEECHTVPQISVLGSSAVSRRLRKELGDLLIDDLDVLAGSMSERAGEPLAISIAAGLRELTWLPERAPISEMYSLTQRAFAQLGWQAKAIEFRRAVAGWIGSVPGSISRIFWLQWIADVLAFVERQRVLAGRHPYARVHLIAFADAAPLEWSHVILGELNEGAWPLAPDDEGWLAEPEIVALNARARILNIKALEQGRHGEGHDVIRPGHTWCLTGSDARAILQRQFFNLMENVGVGVSATATLRSPDEPERVSPPGEFFARLYFCARGRAVSPEIMSALQSETSRWLESTGLWPESAIDVASVKETRNAWNARRRDGRPFGEYEFALKSAPIERISLAATKWERALTSPSHVFLDLFLNVTEPEEPDPDLTARAIGTWAHRWLARIGGSSRDGVFLPLPMLIELEKVVRSSAVADRKRVEELLAKCGRSLPDWWVAIWDDALANAIALVRKIPAGAGWTHCATEFRLGAMSVAIAGDAELRLSGQIDLLLSQGVATTTRLPNGMVWIVDYKTSDPEALKIGRFAEGDGLQLGLYGLAARVLGATTVQMSRIGRSLDLAAPQITGEDLNGLESLWQSLVAMQESGRFGMLGAIRSPYGVRVTYPLATLGIDETLLKSKWALTHSTLNGGDE
jgi:hypothetical protein